MPKGFFIQYKFIIPKTVKHNSYTYQKLFRAIYGYTQNVTKSNGKTYAYHRKGVLSDFPHIRPGKNCVIIPTAAFNNLTNFFKTGKNPTHFWRVKGDWKAVYYMDEKNISEQDAILALEDTLKSSYVENVDGDYSSLESELNVLLDRKKNSSKIDAGYLSSVVTQAEKIFQSDWFKECYSKSEKLVDFSRKLKELKA